MTLAFGAVTLILFLAIGVGLYVSVASALLDEIDTGLRFRAATIQAQAPIRLEDPVALDPKLAEPGEALAQVVAADGAVLQASPPQLTVPVLPAEVTRSLDGQTTFERPVPGIGGLTRLLAVPVESGESGPRRSIVVVGASMQDRADTLHLLAGFLGVAEPLALLVACVAGWRVAGTALGPVERMRSEAAAVAVSGLDRRLTVPRGDDEITRLGRTLNEMLDRLESAFRGERRFLDTASHELRTPLAALRAELDLALARPRGLAETRAALMSASEETDRLTRLAEDLLVLARAQQGRLPLHRTQTSLRELVTGTARRWRSRAAAAGVRIDVQAADTPVFVDPTRIRQALDNLLDNAVRHCPHGAEITMFAVVRQGTVRIQVSDGGPGLPDDVTTVPAVDGETRPAAGLGLRIVGAVAEAHRGTLELGNRPEGGARITLTLPAPPGP
jgi:signal transduction histidine kinase